MKVTSKDIASIRPGCSVTFKCDDPKDLYTAKSLSYIVRNRHPELGVRLFSTKINILKNEITIEAIPVDPKKSKRA
jgi:hypothetical protein